MFIKLTLYEFNIPKYFATDNIMSMCRVSDIKEGEFTEIERKGCASTNICDRVTETPEQIIELIREQAMVEIAATMAPANVARMRVLTEKMEDDEAKG
jgi:hypothetical protein